MRWNYVRPRLNLTSLIHRIETESPFTKKHRIMAGGFEALGLAPELIRAVTEGLGYLLPTNVQDEAIPLILGGGDVMVAAETGSGKTAAFSLPLLQIIHEDLRRRSSGSSSLQGRGAGSISSAARNRWRISVVDKDDDIAVSPDGLACQCRAPKWAGARGHTGVSGGVYCFEVSALELWSPLFHSFETWAAYFCNS